MGDSGNLTSIILALLALLTVVVGALIWFAKWFAKHYGQDMKAHTGAAIASANASKNLSKAVKRNTEASDQMITFMKALNGKLAKATIQTIKEQKVEHQVVKDTQHEKI